MSSAQHRLPTSLAGQVRWVLGAPRPNGLLSLDMLHWAALVAQRERWTHSRAARRADVDAIPLRSPIFMLGTQGGGLTLLARVLKRNSEAVCATGGSDQWVGSDEIGTQPTRMVRLPRGLWGCKHRSDLADAGLGPLHSNEYATSELLPFYRRVAADATEEDAAAFQRILREHIAVYAENPQHARFIDKTQTYTLATTYIDALLGDARPQFLLVTRSPYVMAYRSVMRQPGMWARRLSFEERFRLAAEHYATSYRVALEDGATLGDRFAVVRFEDFLDEPVGVVRTLCAWLGLEFDDDMLPAPHHRLPFARWPGDTKWYPLLRDSWSSQLSDDQRALVEEVCGEVSRRLGYEPDGIVAPQVPTLRAASDVADPLQAA